MKLYYVVAATGFTYRNVIYANWERVWVDTEDAAPYVADGTIKLDPPEQSEVPDVFVPPRPKYPLPEEG